MMPMMLDIIQAQLGCEQAKALKKECEMICWRISELTTEHTEWI